MEYDEKLKKAQEDPSKKPAYDMKLEALLPVVRKELPMKMHVHRTDDIFTAIRIAKEFDIQIPDDQAENIATVGQAISYIEEAKK